MLQFFYNQKKQLKILNKILQSTLIAPEDWTDEATPVILSSLDLTYRQRRFLAMLIEREALSLAEIKEELLVEGFGGCLGGLTKKCLSCGIQPFIKIEYLGIGKRKYTLLLSKNIQARMYPLL